MSIELNLRLALHQLVEAIEYTPMGVRGIKAMANARKALEAAQQPATGEPVYWEWRHLSTHPNTVDFGQWSEWQRVEARNAIHTIEGALAEFRTYIAQGYKYELRALYTTPQPAQAQQAASAEDMKVYDSIADRYFREATQAEVADEQILEIAEPFGEFQYGDAQGHKRIDFARAILAQRPERVPMTDEQWLEYLLRNANNSVLHVAAFVGESIQTRGQWVLLKPANDLRKLVEQAYGITAQAKKEGA